MIKALFNGISYFALFLVFALASPVFAQSVSFTDAVRLALENDNSIKSDLEKLNSIKELKNQAINLRRPVMQFDASTSLQKYGSIQNFMGQDYSDWRNNYASTAAVTLSQPLLTGGRAKTSLREADLRIAQQIERIYSNEISVSLSVIEAYSDIIRDNEILNARLESVKNLEKQQEVAIALREAGIVGLTEVAQSKTRLASTKARAIESRTNLLSSWITLNNLVGKEVSGLTDRNLELTIPNSSQEAFEIALKNNASLMYMRINEDLAKVSAEMVKSEYNPKASLQLSSTAYLHPNGNKDTKVYDNQVSLKISIPIWNGGQGSSRIRASLSDANAARYTVFDSESKLKQQIAMVWEKISSSKEIIKITQEQIQAAEAARKGVEIEQKIGERTILDILNQEQEVLDAKITLAVSKHDLLVSSARLYEMMGYDPSGILDEGRTLELYKSTNSKVNNKYNKFEQWEKPLVFLPDLLLPLDDFTVRNFGKLGKIKEAN